MKILKYLILFCSLSPIAAIAAFPAGQWTTRFYSDTNSGFTSLGGGVCIKADGTWYADTTNTPPFTLGFWVMKGNDLHLHRGPEGTAATQTAELTRTGPNLLTGYWQQWYDDERDVGINNQHYLQVSLSFKSATCTF